MPQVQLISQNHRKTQIETSSYHSEDCKTRWNTIQDPAIGSNNPLCSWIKDILMGCPQVVKVTSNTALVYTGAPQGCVLCCLPTPQMTGWALLQHKVADNTARERPSLQ
ncbi:hypothetical protein DPEC_G00063820 [Dallia pectoralis]|uniref:Uncharacterized protein n=1 Tax=Dallia pectoralis TaxID=75939 RepID=A0ACC2H870_DALPE|nr:hypothetical protein DPEC_G00063820 [Dallia pectoralis]